MYEERHVEAEDGIRLYCRDYPHPSARVPVLCLPGLTIQLLSDGKMVKGLIGLRKNPSHTGQPNMSDSLNIWGKACLCRGQGGCIIALGLGIKCNPCF